MGVCRFPVSYKRGTLYGKRFRFCGSCENARPLFLNDSKTYWKRLPSVSSMCPIRSELNQNWIRFCFKIGFFPSKSGFFSRNRDFVSHPTHFSSLPATRKLSGMGLVFGISTETIRNHYLVFVKKGRILTLVPPEQKMHKGHPPKVKCHRIFLHEN